jgi:hypothetical protein
LSATQGLTGAYQLLGKENRLNGSKMTDTKETKLLSFEKYDKEQKCIAVRRAVVCVFGEKNGYT